MEEHDSTNAATPPQSGGVCPNGHEVPPWRSSCGVCGLEMPVPPGAPSTEHTALRSGPSRRTWAILAALAIAAIAAPLFRPHVLLEDDFSGPAVLRTWPDNGATLAYVDGAYHASVLTAGDSPWAYQRLTRRTGAITIDVDVDVVRGAPLVAINCVSRARETSGADGTTQVTASTFYAFVLASDGSGYAIVASDRDQPLAVGNVSVGGGTVHLRVGCSAGGSGTRLTMRVNGGDPLTYTDSTRSDSFGGIGLGVYADTAGAEVGYDNLRVVAGDGN